MQTQAKAQIISVGSYLPPNEVSNDVLRHRFSQINQDFVDKVERVTGICTRWHADEAIATSDLVVPAALQALNGIGLSADKLDLIVLGTDTPDYVTPATSVLVQHKLGATHAGTFDVHCACASFPTALSSAAALMSQNSNLRYVLVAGAYRMSKFASPDDVMSFFYGDGASVVILSSSKSPGVLGATYFADGSYAKNWGIFAGGTAEPASVEAIEAGRTQIRVLDRVPVQLNEEGWPKLIRRLAEQNSFTVEDIDLLIFTQVRAETIQNVMYSLGLPMQRTHMIMDWAGYTGSACIPMAFHDAIVCGKVQKDGLVVMVGSGVGYNQAAVAIRLAEVPWAKSFRHATKE